MPEKTLAVGIVAYLLGAIPFGYFVFKLFRGQDIRATGSGSTGATNVVRGAGLLAGGATLLLDASKGYASVAIASHWFGGSKALEATAAVCAIAGHIFPVFLKFRGGKGVATGLGAFSAIVPGSVVVCAGVFVAVFAIGRYVSLASMVAVGAFPLVVAMRGEAAGATLAGALGSAALILTAHRSNIRRLRTGKELPIAPHGKR